MSRSRGGSDASGLLRSSPPHGEAATKEYLLNVFLQNGRNLAIRDASGTSDPYVKFFYKNKLIYRSDTIEKNVNPQWEERFAHVIDDITVPLKVEVWDEDRYHNDDFMGYAIIDLFKLDSNPVEARVDLADKMPSGAKVHDLGYLTMSMQLLPAHDPAAEDIIKRTVTQEEEKAHGKKVKRKTDVKESVKVWTDHVRIVLIGARNLVEPKMEGVNMENAPDTYVRFQLGDQKCKSKIVYNSWAPQWLEQFVMHARDNESRILEVALIDKSKGVFIGRCAIDLAGLQSQKVENTWYRLDNGITEVRVSLTYSGKLASQTVSVCDSEDGLVHRLDETSTPELRKSYELKNFWRNIWDVGFLVVKVHKARDLKGSDIPLVTSDPYCVVELGNARLETHTEHKTKNPEWFTTFTFFVNDINSILEVTVFDQDKLKKNEFVGKVAIPLLNVINDEPIWYQLKNKHLTKRVKGDILLEMNVTWNPVRAAVATYLPPEKKYEIKEDPFRPTICLRNIERLNRFAVVGYDGYLYMQYILSWENPQLTTMAFLVSLIVAGILQPWMIPMGPLALFAIVYLRKRQYENETGTGAETESITGISNTPDDATLYTAEEEEEMEEEDENTDEKNWKIVRSYLRYKEAKLFYVQNALDLTATFVEKVKNILEFKQPFISWLSIFSLVIAVIIMMIVPLRYLAMAWIIKKFTRKLRNPYTPPSNEVLDFIARAPSDIDLKSYYGYKRDSAADEFINTKIHTYAATRKRGRKWYHKLFGIKGPSKEE